MFFLSVVLVFWAKVLKTSISLEKRNIIKALWVCLLVGVSASLFHIGVSQIDPARAINPDFALLTDIAFFSFMSFLVFASTSKIDVLTSKTKSPNMLIANFVHVFVNSAVILLK
jgi:hypothetical protein